MNEKSKEKQNKNKSKNRKQNKQTQVEKIMGGDRIQSERVIAK